MAKINGKWFVENIGGPKYILEEISIENLGDYERRLYRVTNEYTKIVHYKGINISKSRIAKDKNKSMSRDEIFQLGENRIENALIDGNEANIEFVFRTDNEYKRLLGEDGNYLPTEIKLNVYVGNLANEYSSIPGEKNG